MKRLLLIFTCLLITLSTYSQVLKTYSGQYNINEPIERIPYDELKGNARYTYYENKDYERILSGNFIYSGNYTNIFGTKMNVNSTGAYKDNLKNGIWQSKLVLTNGKKILNYNALLNYSKGIPNGLWKFDFSDNTDKSNIENAALTFTNNIVVGKFTIRSLTKKVEILGQNDNNGYLTGKITINYLDTNEELIMDYENGFQIKYILRNKGTGIVSDKYNALPDEIENFHKIKQLTIAGDQLGLDKLSFKLKDNNNDFIYNAFVQLLVYAPSNVFSGDKSFDLDSKSFKWVGFKTKFLEKQDSN
jgi:hypothetical protein